MNVLKITSKNLYLPQVVVFMVSQKKFVTKNQNLIQCLYTQSAKWHANSRFFHIIQKVFHLQSLDYQQFMGTHLGGGLILWLIDL